MTDTDPVTVFIADDHPVYRKGLRDIIEADSRLRFAGEAGDGIEAVRGIETLRPRVAVLDLNMPRMSGLDVARDVSRTSLPVAIVFLTLYDDEAFFTEAMELGARGYLLKDTAATDIVRCILAVAAGDIFITPSLTGRALKARGPFEASDSATAGIARLSPAERRILRHIADYKSTEQIALELFISPKTVDNHRTNICRKLGLAGRNTLLRYALEHRHLL